MIRPQHSMRLLATSAMLIGAVSAASAGEARGPIMADGFGLSIGGQYRMMANAGNVGYHQRSVFDSPSDRSFVNQRLRTWLNLHEAGEQRYGAYLQVEIGHTAWGAGGEFPKPDGVELRRGYLWLEPTESSLLRVGVLDWHDAFGERPTFGEPQWAVDDYDSFRSLLANSIWDFDVSGVDLEWGLAEDAAWHGRGSMLVLQRSGSTLTGDGSAQLLGLDLDHSSNDGDLIGASLYYLRDHGDYAYGTFGGPEAEYESSWDLWAGVRGQFERGALASSLFLIYNAGETSEPDWSHAGWAARAMISRGETLGGTFHAQLLYTSGDDGSDPADSGEFRTIGQSERDDLGAASYWSLLALSSPHGPSDVIDLGIGPQNGGLGLMTVQAALERPLDDTRSLYFAAGWLRAAEDNPRSGSADIGFEFLGELGWKLFDGLSLNLGASVLAAGDFFRGDPTAPEPGTLFETYARLQLEL